MQLVCSNLYNFYYKRACTPPTQLYSNLLGSITFIIVIRKKIQVDVPVMWLALCYISNMLFVHIIIVGERNKQENFFIFNVSFSLMLRRKQST